MITNAIKKVALRNATLTQSLRLTSLPLAHFNRDEITKKVSRSKQQLPDKHTVRSKVVNLKAQ
jgi:hypothetical protein